MRQREAPGPAAIRAHLDRVLESAAFRTSRRSREFLRFVVGRKLEGREEQLKERLIGVEVFQRPLSYDPSLDSIVRVNANDVRKRLAQYYNNSDADMRIELPPGSYVPEFNPVEHALPFPLAQHPPTGHRSRLQLALTGGLGIVISLLAVFFLAHAFRKTALERFWAPLLSSRATPLVLVGTGRAVILPLGKETFTASEILTVPGRNLARGDFMAAFSIASQLQQMGRRCQLKPGTTLSLEEMQTHPVIVIGAFNNPWTLQLNRDVRFILQSNESPTLREYYIIDKQRPGVQWKVVAEDPIFPWKVEHDYAIITRLVDATTRQVFVSAGGVTHFGTQAAGEFLATPSYWERLAAQAPSDWVDKNMQIVLEVRVVNDAAKPPAVIASYFW